MYRTDVYFLSKTVAEAPFYIFFPIILTSIVYYMIGLNPDVIVFFKTVGINILVANVSVSFGMS